ncbi:hypothetical protein GCM10009845_24340 [Pedococcus bigeumensis]
MPCRSCVAGLNGVAEKVRPGACWEPLTSTFLDLTYPATRPVGRDGSTPPRPAVRSAGTPVPSGPPPA